VAPHAARRREIVLLLYRAGSGSDATAADAQINEPEPSPREDSEDPPARKRTSEKTWIEIELVDDDQPVAGALYRMKLTDGSIREGSFDSAGRARFTGIDPGTCEVCFPKIDAAEWHPA